MRSGDPLPTRQSLALSAGPPRATHPSHTLSWLPRTRPGRRSRRPAAWARQWPAWPLLRVSASARRRHPRAGCPRPQLPPLPPCRRRSCRGRRRPRRRRHRHCRRTWRCPRGCPQSSCRLRPPPYGSMLCHCLICRCARRPSRCGPSDCLRSAMRQPHDRPPRWTTWRRTRRQRCCRVMCCFLYPQSLPSGLPPARTRPRRPRFPNRIAAPTRCLAGRSEPCAVAPPLLSLRPLLCRWRLQQWRRRRVEPPRCPFGLVHSAYHACWQTQRGPPYWAVPRGMCHYRNCGAP
jgi:hypothetical protein